MLRAEDYIGIEFGQFQLANLTGRGAEAEVFECSDLRTNRKYIVRLDIKDDLLWEREEPLLPPRNISIEKDNAVNSGGALTDMFRMSLKLNVPFMYAFRDYLLVPVNNTIKVKNSLDILEVEAKGKSMDIIKLRTWDKIAKWLYAETMNLIEKKITKEQWNERWGLLIGGNELLVYMKKHFYINDERFIEIITDKNHKGEELIQNKIFRLCAAVELGSISMENAIATLRCQHFRINISNIEYYQILKVVELLKDIQSGVMSFLKILSEFGSVLIEQPYNRHDNKDEFILNERLNDINAYSLIIQEHVGIYQPHRTIYIPLPKF